MKSFKLVLQASVHGDEASGEVLAVPGGLVPPPQPAAVHPRALRLHPRRPRLQCCRHGAFCIIVFLMFSRYLMGHL